MNSDTTVVQFEQVRKQELGYSCSACGADRGCDCNAPAIKKAADALARNPRKSNRAIAEEIGVDKNTVRKARRTGGDDSPPPVDAVIGRDGKSYPAKRPRADTPEASADAMKAKFAAGEKDDEPNGETDDQPDQTKQPARAEVAKLVRVWVQASPEARREFVRERWDEISLTRKQLDTNGNAAHEDRWLEGDTA
jgi:hypothetical protein